jgi:hypothetical protein
MMNDDQRFASRLEDRMLDLARDSGDVSSPAHPICIAVSELVADPRSFDVKLAYCVEALFGTCPYSLHVSGPTWLLEVANGTTGEIWDGLAYRELRNVPVVIPGTDRSIATLSIGANQDGTPIPNFKQRLELLTRLVGYILLWQFPELTGNCDPELKRIGHDGPFQSQGHVPGEPRLLIPSEAFGLR